jgi:hypothetical protein
MDQGVLSAYKADYHRKTFAKFTHSTDDENKPTVQGFWKSFNIKDPTDIIAE